MPKHLEYYNFRYLEFFRIAVTFGKPFGIDSNLHGSIIRQYLIFGNILLPEELFIFIYSDYSVTHMAACPILEPLMFKYTLLLSAHILSLQI